MKTKLKISLIKFKQLIKMAKHNIELEKNLFEKAEIAANENFSQFDSEMLPELKIAENLKEERDKSENLLESNETNKYTEEPINIENLLEKLISNQEPREETFGNENKLKIYTLIDETTRELVGKIKEVDLDDR